MFDLKEFDKNNHGQTTVEHVLSFVVKAQMVLMS